MKTLVQAVKDYALAHYDDGGWDMIVECWSDETIADHLTEYNITTEEGAIEYFRPVAAVWAERQADARNSAF